MPETPPGVIGGGDVGGVDKGVGVVGRREHTIGNNIPIGRSISTGGSLH